MIKRYRESGEFEENVSRWSKKLIVLNVKMYENVKSYAEKICSLQKKKL